MSDDWQPYSVLKDRFRESLPGLDHLERLTLDPTSGWQGRRLSPRKPMVFKLLPEPMEADQ